MGLCLIMPRPIEAVWQHHGSSGFSEEPSPISLWRLTLGLGLNAPSVEKGGSLDGVFRLPMVVPPTVVHRKSLFS